MISGLGFLRGMPHANVTASRAQCPDGTQLNSDSHFRVSCSGWNMHMDKGKLNYSSYSPTELRGQLFPLRIEERVQEVLQADMSLAT